MDLAKLLRKGRSAAPCMASGAGRAMAQPGTGQFGAGNALSEGQAARLQEIRHVNRRITFIRHRKSLCYHWFLCGCSVYTSEDQFISWLVTEGRVANKDLNMSIIFYIKILGMRKYENVILKGSISVVSKPVFVIVNVNIQFVVCLVCKICALVRRSKFNALKFRNI